MEVRLVLVTEELRDALNVGLLESVEIGYLYDAGEDCAYYACLERLPVERWCRCDQNHLVWFMPIPYATLEKVVSKCADSPAMLDGGFDEPQLKIRPGSGGFQGIKTC